MKIFLSWSGETSHGVALALRDWIPSVIQVARPWLSSADIGSGARWSPEIQKALNESPVGVLCMTPDNLDAPWLNFEAGALSKAASDEFVCPYLLKLSLADLKQPIAQFQARLSDRAGTYKMMTTINSALKGNILADAVLERVFDKWWPDLEKELAKVSAAAADPPARRDEVEILDEILNLLRVQERRYALEQQRLETNRKFSEAFSRITSGSVLQNPISSALKADVGSEQFRNYLATLLKQGYTKPPEDSAASDNDDT